MNKRLLRTLALMLALLILPAAHAWADSSSLIADPERSVRLEGAGLSAGSGTAAASSVKTQNAVCNGEKEFVDALRGHLSARDTSFEIAFKCTGDISKFLSEAWGKALSHTGKPKEGDYIRWQYSSCRYYWTYRSDGCGGYYTVASYTLSYYTTAAQEAQVDACVSRAIQSLNIPDNASDYEKIKKIYSYICGHVRYDYEHLNDSGYTLKYTAYGAIVNGKAGCQGFALLVYRMMLACDIDCRLIAGTAGGGAHGWNIVKCAGSYYNLDAAWDCGRTETGFRYFLAGEDSFKDRTRRTEYSLASFEAEYPVDCADARPGLSAPVLKSASNVSGGVKVTWNTVPGAAKYRVFYKLSGASAWTKAADVAASGSTASGSTASGSTASYTVKGLKSGKKYVFTVRCMNSAGTSATSGYDSAGKSLAYIAAPVLKSAANVNGGVKVTWDTVPGAAKYRVFYKLSGASTWTKAADVAAGTSGSSAAAMSYTVKGLKSGKKYVFTVRCMNSAGTSATSSYDTAGKSLTYIAAPVLKSAVTVNGGVKVTWNAVPGAANYRVFYKLSGAPSWTKAADVAAGTSDTSGSTASYTVKGLKSGKKYVFTVRCMNSAGTSATSSYDTAGKSRTYIAAPVLKSAANVSGGVKVTWNAVPGAAKYRVFYKLSGASSWTKAADVSGTSASSSGSATRSYTVKGLKSGKKYVFTVRCMNSAGTSATSGYDSAGKSIVYKK